MFLPNKTNQYNKREKKIIYENGVSFLYTMMLLDVSRMDRCGNERRLGVIYVMKYKYKYIYI